MPRPASAKHDEGKHRQNLTEEQRRQPDAAPVECGWIFTTGC